ncbi:hypothetical protein VSWAT3_22150 [Vibrionales bacterium SWAT-3]|nr:hypothetical protein VSWAT3_22150 [Vibrionales bacterium SWAT-3]
MLHKIRLNDDEEPWLLGDAEIYAIIAGISPEEDKPEVRIVDMPYLDTEDKQYYPN